MFECEIYVSEIESRLKLLIMSIQNSGEWRPHHGHTQHTKYSPVT